MDCKAKPEDWELQSQWASDCADARCLLELRARVELLESTQHAHIEVNSKPTSNPSQIGFLLVERVMTAIECADGDDEARAAIREVAAWLREASSAGWTVDQALFNLGECTYEDMGFESKFVIAELLEREAEI